MQSQTKLEFTRGQLAQAAGCGAETIRYYESNGLLPKPRRAANGYRIYDDESRKRLSFVLRLRGLGFTIEEIRKLCLLMDKDDYGCGDIHAITVEHLGAVKEKIRELQQMQKRLKELAEMCGKGALPDCPIIDALYA